MVKNKKATRSPVTRRGWVRTPLVGSRKRLGNCYWGFPRLQIALAYKRGDIVAGDLQAIADWVNRQPVK